jgi:CRP-like cAMP-binding protein
MGDCWRNLLPPSQGYPAGIGLFSQGAGAQEAYWVDDGLVKLVWVDSHGHEFIVGLRYPGTFIGLAPVILNAPHPVSAITMAQSRLVRVPANLLLSLVKANPEISSAAHEMLSREVCDLATRMAELGCLSSRERVKKMLRQIVQLSQREIQRTTRETRFLLPLRQCELASMLAVTPEHLSRILKQLRQEGIIRWHKGWLVVPDVSRLQG